MDSAIHLLNNWDQIVCDLCLGLSIPPYSPKGREIWDSCKYVQAKSLKPDTLEALSTAKVFAAQEDIFRTESVQVCCKSSIKPSSQSLISPLPPISRRPPFSGEES